MEPKIILLTTTSYTGLWNIATKDEEARRKWNSPFLLADLLQRDRLKDIKTIPVFVIGGRQNYWSYQGLEASIEPHVSRSSRDLWLRAKENLWKEKKSGAN